MMQASDAIPHSKIWGHLPNDTQLFNVAELRTMRRCSWLLVRPL